MSSYFPDFQPFHFLPLKTIHTIIHFHFTLLHRVTRVVHSSLERTRRVTGQDGTDTIDHVTWFSFRSLIKGVTE